MIRSRSNSPFRNDSSISISDSDGVSVDVGVAVGVTTKRPFGGNGQKTVSSKIILKMK